MNTGSPLLKKILVYLFILIFVVYRRGWQTRGEIAITVLDVGQGDSLVITTPKGRRILIDGGPDDSVISELAVVSTYLNADIDYVFVTHNDSDHIAGIFKVAEYYSPDFYGINLEVGDSDLVSWWTRGARTVIAGEVWLIDGVRFEVLWPTEKYISTASDPNNASIVIKVIYGSFCGLLTGDIEKEVEDDLIDLYGDKLQCEFLKVPHHGSKSSSSKEFLDVVSPSVAVISAGEGNTYGHPHKEVLQRYEEAGVVVLRTDQDGRITVSSDGSSFWW